jgi:hypothetical protein
LKPYANILERLRKRLENSQQKVEPGDNRDRASIPNSSEVPQKVSGILAKRKRKASPSSH